MTAADERGPSYDVVIVGAGASACGLLYGILRRHTIVSSSSGADKAENENERKQQAAPVQPLPFTIAILDRGGSSSSSSSSSSNMYRSKPSDWFRASHSSGEGGTANRTPTLLQTTPQVGLGNRIVEVPIGDGLGGSTNINACLVAAPSQHDFDDWPDDFSGSKMVDAVNHISRVMRNNDAIELTTFNEANNNNNCGGATPTMSSLDPAQFPSKVDRVATASRTARNDDLHMRVNYFDGLIRPLLDEYPQLHQYVTFLEGFDVQRILLEEGRNEKDNNISCRAAGVECNVVTGRTVRIRARKELILCAGAIMSPALLMVSGIGPHDVLSNQGIPLPPKINTSPPGWNMVGKGLTDHIVLPRAFLTLPGKWCGKSVSGIQSWENAMDEQSLYQLAITDGLCSTQLIPHFVAAFFRRRGSGIPRDEQKDRYQACNGIVDTAWAITFGIVRFILQLLLVWTPLGLIAKHCTGTINICLLNPVSKGYVTIQKRMKCGSPPARLEEFNIVVDPGYLSAARDMKAIEQGWQLSEMIRAKHFASCLEILPSFAYRHLYPLAKRFLHFFCFGTKQKDWIFQFASDFSCPYFHWNGTCAMGKKASASVVNSRLEVSGINGLRICDASVFPSNVSCPPALVCTSLGYVASNLVAGSAGCRKGPEEISTLETKME